MTWLWGPVTSLGRCLCFGVSMLTKAWGVASANGIATVLWTYISRTGSNNFVEGFFQKRRHVGCGRVVVGCGLWVVVVCRCFL